MDRVNELKSMPFHLFQFENRNFLIDIEGMSVFSIPEVEATIINKKIGDCVVKNDFSLLKKIYEKYNLLRKVEEKDYFEKEIKQRISHIDSISLFVTQDCNFRCIYCYGDGGGYGSGGEMSLEDTYSSVDWLINQSKGVKKLNITFFGGEPLLSFSLIEKTVSYALQRGELSDKIFNFGLTTNASLLDEEKIDFLKKYEFNTLVSLDGGEELQNYQRPFKDGSGSYSTVISKIRALLLDIPDASCRATVMGDTSIVDLDVDLRKIGFRNRTISIASFSLFGNNNKIQKQSTTRILEKIDFEAKALIETLQNKNNPRFENFQNSIGLMTVLEGFINSQKKIFPCGAGRSAVGVSCEGEVFLCHRFVGHNAYQLGSVHDDDIPREEYHSSPLNCEPCKSCFAKYFCGGGCYYERLASTGSLLKVDEEKCNILKYTVELAAVIFSDMSKEDLKFLRDNGIIAKQTCPYDLF